MPVDRKKAMAKSKYCYYCREVGSLAIGKMMWDVYERNRMRHIPLSKRASYLTIAFRGFGMSVKRFLAFLKDCPYTLEDLLSKLSEEEKVIIKEMVKNPSPIDVGVPESSIVAIGLKYVVFKE